MKQILTAFILLAGIYAQAQTVRYFEFRPACGHGNWQDTSFIAAASDAALIDTVLAELGKPFDERRFIGGPITGGNGGYNRNAGHWFKWHFIPDQWELADVATEVCDGCPYTDVDADTAYWISNIGHFCPWSGRLSREVTGTMGVVENPPVAAFGLYPNPATDKITLGITGTGTASISIYNAVGTLVMRLSDLTANTIDVSTLGAGLYFLQVNTPNYSGSQKFIVTR